LYLNRNFQGGKSPFFSPADAHANLIIVPIPNFLPQRKH